MRFSLVLWLLFSIPLQADKFPELLNTESTTDSNPPSAEESAQSFSLPDGVKVQVWAGEPEVQNPIAMAWDRKGRISFQNRLWGVLCSGYVEKRCQRPEQQEIN